MYYYVNVQSTIKRKGDEMMSEANKNIKLTNDSLTNIHIMIPMLNDRAREAISYLMYGCFIGEEVAESKNTKKKKLQEV